ncbi:pyridoxal kinase [Niabella aurantiaca]|uniref:pyridoxal kinase n=1 Tax=Niabella aurantiaca TaxID=379900 RepID=UPI000476E326|nr:pyridoxal kinase [Niabella aurantiaca]
MRAMKKRVLTIQSQVAIGYVGNNIAAIALQLCGSDPVQVPTVMLSNHIEYPEVYGRPVEPALFSALLKGVAANGIVDDCSFLISGFCNDKVILSLLADFIRKTRPHAGYRYLYDPVCGDFRAGGLYIPKAVADHSIATLLPLSDLITPNHFELEYILGRKINSEEEFYNAVTGHPLLRSRTVIVTSAGFVNLPEDRIAVMLFTEGQIARFETDRVPVEVIGTGDLFAAIVAAQLNLGRDIGQAVDKAVRYLHAVLRYSFGLGETDLTAAALIKCLDVLQ